MAYSLKFPESRHNLQNTLDCFCRITSPKLASLPKYRHTSLFGLDESSTDNVPDLSRFGKSKVGAAIMLDIRLVQCKYSTVHFDTRRTGPCGGIFPQ